MLKKLHRANAVALVTFLTFHLGNHLVATIGPEAHREVMGWLRLVYRAHIVEIALFALFAAQIVLGLLLIWRRGRPKEAWAWGQVVSGFYLAFFLVQHLVAVISVRIGYPSIDTDVWWAASVVSRPPLSLYFAPYYVLAVTALFVHLASAWRFATWPTAPSLQQRMLAFAGFPIGTTIVAALMGAFGAMTLPMAYERYLTSFFGVFAG